MTAQGQKFTILPHKQLNQSLNITIYIHFKFDLTFNGSLKIFMKSELPQKVWNVCLAKNRSTYKLLKIKAQGENK